MSKRTQARWDAAAGAGANARSELPKLAADYFAEVRKTLAENPTLAELHRVRLATKRLRYTLELFLPMYGPRLAERVDQVRKIQSLLGDRQDCVVLGERLKKKDGLPSSLHATIEKLSADGRALEERFRRHWHAAFDAPGEEAAWIRYLSRRPPDPRRRLLDVQTRLLSRTALLEPRTSAAPLMQPAASVPPEKSKRPSALRRAPDPVHLPIHE